MNQQDVAPLRPKEKSEMSNVAKLLDQQKAQIARALPKHLNPNRMARIALTEVRKNPELSMCCPLSFLGSIIQCAQLGLEPGNALGHVYLIPFWNKKKGLREVQVIPGYRGLIDLARRSGQIISISARTVHEYDHFEYEYGLDERLVHKPNSDERGDLIGAYAVAKLRDGGQQFEYMSRREIDKIKKDSNPVWKDHYEEMARKTLVRRLFKYLPVSIEIASMLEISDKEDSGLGQDNDSILIDVGVEPIDEPTETVAAANKAIAADGKKDAEAKEKTMLLGKLDLVIKRELKCGVEKSNLESIIGCKISDASQIDIPKLYAILEALG